MRKLQAMDWHVAIASGGFTFYANHLKDSLRLIAVYANQLEIKDGKLTGKVKGPVVDAKYKAQALVKLAEFLNIPLEQTVAIGDGANDLKMLKKPVSALPSTPNRKCMHGQKWLSAMPT